MAIFDIITDLLLNIAILLLSLLLIGAICVAIYFWIKRQKQYKQFKCVIFERDSFGQWVQTNDQAGIFVDNKTKNKRLFLKKNRVGLNPDNIPYITGVKTKTIYLLKKGLKNFLYIKLNIQDENINIHVGEEDVNWAINSYERQKKLFAQGLLIQLLPFIALAFVAIIILILFVYLFKNIGVLKDVAIAFQDAARQFAQASTGTTIIAS